MIKLIQIYFLALLVVFSSLTGSCSRRNNTKNSIDSSSLSQTDTAKIIFKEYEHNFGKVVEGEKVVCTFTFENTGTGPLVIASATTSCGCTVTKYNNKPVLPGESGIIEVAFDSSGRNGIQTKTVTVRSNASKPVVLLRIAGEVITSTNN